MENYSIYQLFRAKFDRTDFNSMAEFLQHQRESDEWWKQNHGETPEDHRLRIEYSNRPRLGGIIKS